MKKYIFLLLTTILALTTAASADRSDSVAIKLRQGLTHGTSGTQIFDTYGTGSEEQLPNPWSAPVQSMGWNANLADQSGLMTFVAFDIAPDALFAVYEDTGTGVGLYDGLKLLGMSAGVNAQVTIPVTAGKVYYALIGLQAPPTSTTVQLKTYRWDLSVIQSKESILIRRSGESLGHSIISISQNGNRIITTPSTVFKINSLPKGTYTISVNGFKGRVRYSRKITL
jgi:hypothetical protein